MATLQELLAQRAALEKEIASRQSAERIEAISKVRSLMAEYGLTAADLAPAKGVKEKAPKSTSGSKVAPKYRDENGNSWTGRGLQPKWLKAALASGKQLSDFAI
jgi:DNA-binding protein H-NS